jgi:hypothetical protein
VEQWLHTGETASARWGGWGLTRRREREAEEPSARRGGAFPAEDTTWQRALLGSIGVLCSGTAMAVVAAMPSPACSAAWRALHLRCAITPPRVSFTCWFSDVDFDGCNQLEGAVQRRASLFQVLFSLQSVAAYGDDYEVGMSGVRIS